MNGNAFVVAGDYNLNEDEGEQSVAVSKFYSHEEYDPDTLKNDICILHLDKPLTLNGQT